MTELSDLRTKLKAAGLNQAWAARRLGITPGYFTMLINKRANPSTDLLQRMKTLSTQLERSGLARAVS